MPFRAEFELVGRDSRFLWTKAVSAFHTISDSFKIVIRQKNDRRNDLDETSNYSELLFTAMNKTKTTILTMSFKECFFHKFQIDGQMSEVTEEDEQNHARSYTLIVNSYDMNILFKDCGNDAKSWKIFLLCNEEIGNEIYSNKLFVEFDTKTEMKKRYSISYRPSVNTFDSRIQFIYLKTLEIQKRQDDGTEDFFDDDDRVHRLALKVDILKNFLQIFPTLIEDFQIKINPNHGNLTLKGFNRNQIISKIENVLNRPMTLNIQLRLDQIVYNNIKEGEDGDSDSFEVSFRLKNFKTFIQIISGAVVNIDSKGDTNNNRTEMINNEDNSICDIMFSKPGYPIIFERKYFTNDLAYMKECCSVRLTEVTDGESNKISLQTSDIGSHSVSSKLNSTRGTTLVPPKNVEREVSEPLFVPEDTGEDQEQIVTEEVNERFWDNERYHKITTATKSHENPTLSTRSSKRTLYDVNEEGNNRKRMSVAARDAIRGDIHKEIPQNFMPEGIEDKELETGDEDDGEYLGPTQNSGIKGIFD